jgi:hypothetical protein
MVRAWGYREVASTHPRARMNGCVLEHILVAERKLGRALFPGEVVHHIDEDRGHNSDDNLMVFRTNADHTRFHSCGVAIKQDDGSYVSPGIRPKNLCAACGKPCRGKHCSVACKGLISRKVERPSHNELAQLMKQMPVVRIARQYGVSDNAVRRWARSYNLL